MAVKRVLVPIGTGSEEMEAVITIDVLRRAGAEVTVASVEDDAVVTCSRKAGSGSGSAGGGAWDLACLCGSVAEMLVLPGYSPMATAQSIDQGSSAMQVKIVADKLVKDVTGDDFDLIALPVRQAAAARLLLDFFCCRGGGWWCYFCCFW